MSVRNQTEFKWLSADLAPGNMLQLSMYPNIPGRDEIITHKVINSQFTDTRSGLLITIDLENTHNGEQYTYVFPDVLKLEMPSNFKYYLHSVDRAKLPDYELEKTEELLQNKEDVNDYNFYINAPTNISRILVIRK